MNAGRRRIGLRRPPHSRRFGPISSREGSNVEQLVKCAPPAHRAASVCGILAPPSAPGQVGAPAPMNTDAFSRLPRTGYQGSEVSSRSREADGFSPVRLAGTASRAQAAPNRYLRGSLPDGLKWVIAPPARGPRASPSRRRTLRVKTLLWKR